MKRCEEFWPSKWQTVTKRRLSRCWRMDLENTIVEWQYEDLQYRSPAAKHPMSSQ